MSRPLPRTTAYEPTDFVELHMGREGWTHADYEAFAIRQCEAGEVKPPIPQHLRAEYAAAFARMSMPHAKYAAHVKAVREARFGSASPDYRVGGFGLERVK